MQNLAWDPGFGGSKIAHITNHKLQTHHLPAVIGVGQLRASSLATGLGNRSRQIRPLQIALNKQHYLVGNNVHKFTRPLERLDFQRLSQGPEIKALLYAALYQALGPGQHQVRLIIALPVALLADAQLAKATSKQLKSWIIGEHHFQAEKQSLSVEITQLKTAPQPLGSFFAWGMDTAGNWVSRDHPHAPVAVADIGFNTLDLFVVEGADINHRYTRGEKLGMRRAAELIQRTIQDHYYIDKSLHECDALMRQYLKYGDALVHHQAGSESINGLIQQALGETFAGIARALESYWGEAEIRRILLTGGGAEALRGQLSSLYPHAIVLPEAHLANASGLAKFAQRPKTFK